MDNVFGITKQEVLELAASKIADEVIAEDSEGAVVSANELIKERLDKLFGERINAAVDAALVSATETALSEKITPVNVWGEKAGSTTTLRAVLRDKANEFWTQPVDCNGKASSGYGCEPRYKHTMKQFLGERFDSAVKNNIVEVVGALKVAMREDMAKKCTAIMDDLIRVKV